MWSITPTAVPGLVQAVVDGLSEGVIVRGANGELLLCNAAAERILRHPARELAPFPRFCDGWQVIDAAGRPLAHDMAPDAVCRRTGHPVRGMMMGMQRPGGATIWLSVNARTVGSPEDADAGWAGTDAVVVSFVDVTETHRLEGERRRLERRLERVNALRLAGGAAMVQAADTDVLLRRTCDIAVRDGGFLLAWVGVADPDTGRVRPVAASGATSYLDDVVITLDPQDPRSHGPTGVAARERHLVLNRDFGTDDRVTPWRERAQAYGFGASAAFPLEWDGGHGVFTVYAAERDFFNEDETRLLEQFVGDLALGLREAAGRRFLATLAANIGEGLIALDRDRRLSYVNEAAMAMLGRSRAELERTDVHDLLHPEGTRPAPCTAATCELLGALASGEAVRANDDFGRADGTTLPVTYTATALGQGSSAGTILVFGDDTRARLELQRVRDELARLSWAGRIRDALAEDGLELYAQPIIDLVTGETVQHELLLRMRGEDGVLILPGVFLPTAEVCGLMPAIDRWVIARAAELALDGHAVQFNLSAASLGDPAMLPYIEATIAGVPPGLLVCEVTETAVVEDRVKAEAFLTRLEELGVAVALDDFGSGYGGFSYLKSFPATYLKIDAEFIGDVADHPASRQVVEVIVRLAHALGKLTVAEGLEDVWMLPLLKELGVDRVQGFGLGRPGPVGEVLATATATHQRR